MGSFLKRFCVPELLRQKKPKRPRARHDGHAVFFAREAAHLAGIPKIDYRQLRRLYDLVTYGERSRRPVAEKGTPWARFSFRDVVALRVAIRLLGGAAAVNARRHLRIARLAKALAKLRTTYGVADPLTQVVLRDVGGALSTEFRGVHFEVDTRQLLLFRDAVEGAVASLASAQKEHQRLKAALRSGVTVARTPPLSKGCTRATPNSRLAVS